MIKDNGKENVEHWNLHYKNQRTVISNCIQNI